MGKAAVVYWSGTGNTKAMADLVAEGAKEAGIDVSVFTADKFCADMANDFDVIAFGCPSMGDEQLEEYEFEPMFSSCINALKSKKVALFGSYGWGDGAWMRSWNESCGNNGIYVIDTFICNEYPDGDAADGCKNLGKILK